MAEWVPRLPWVESRFSQTELLSTREWLVANGLGGYASGTIAGVASRRYHSLLIAALPAPLGRYIMFNHLTELLRFADGSTIVFGGEERSDSQLDLPSAPNLKSFRLELGLPVWRYEVGEIILEKRIFLPHQQNTVYINYRLLEGKDGVRLKLRPAIHFRPIDAPVNQTFHTDYAVHSHERPHEIRSASADLPPLRLHLYGRHAAFTLEGAALERILYRIEESRGYDSRGALWTPGYFRADLTLEDEVTLIGSTES